MDQSSPEPTPRAQERNVLGGPLDPCSTDPMTGYFRDGCCREDPGGVGTHLICCVVTTEFLEHQRAVGNDLTSPRPEFGFPGLLPGDRWCVVAARWQQAFEAGVAPPVVLSATHERALEVVRLEDLSFHSSDVPDDPSSLFG